MDIEDVKGMLQVGHGSTSMTLGVGGPIPFYDSP
jgi:hypothetical protein